MRRLLLGPRRDARRRCLQGWLSRRRRRLHRRDPAEDRRLLDSRRRRQLRRQDRLHGRRRLEPRAGRRRAAAAPACRSAASDLDARPPPASSSPSARPIRRASRSARRRRPRPRSTRRSRASSPRSRPTTAPPVYRGGDDPASSAGRRRRDRSPTTSRGSPSDRFDHRRWLVRRQRRRTSSGTSKTTQGLSSGFVALYNVRSDGQPDPRRPLHPGGRRELRRRDRGGRRDACGRRLRVRRLPRHDGPSGRDLEGVGAVHLRRLRRPLRQPRQARRQGLLRRQGRGLLRLDSTSAPTATSSSPATSAAPTSPSASRSAWRAATTTSSSPCFRAI